MRLVKAAKASPHAKFYNLSTAYNDYDCTRILLYAKMLKETDKTLVFVIVIFIIGGISIGEGWVNDNDEVGS